MTDREEHHQHSPRKHAHSGRGRPGHGRVFHHLGVRDLREIIDRKRSEKGDSGVPPNPSHNYLKDPLRQSEQSYDDSPRHSNRGRPKNPPNNFRRDHRGPPPHHPQHIENPPNIKVEFSTSTGEHSYQLDESTVLPAIRHVPDHPPVQNRGFRGRGRGRGRGPRNYHTRSFRGRQSEPPIEPVVPISQGGAEEDWDVELSQQKEQHEEDQAYQEEDYPEDQGEVGLEQNVESLQLQDENEEKKEDTIEESQPSKDDKNLSKE